MKLNHCWCEAFTLWLQWRADQAVSFQASTNPDRSSFGLFLESELQAHPPYLLFNFQELALCILQENWVKCWCGGISVCVWVWERERHREGDILCVTLTLFHFSSQTQRQIKKLYSNWYDQAEHLSQISNIKIRQSTRLGNKAGPFSSILCLICCEWDGAGSGWMCTTRSTLYNLTGRTEQRQSTCAQMRKTRHTFSRWPARVAPCAVWSQCTTEDIKNFYCIKNHKV